MPDVFNIFGIFFISGNDKIVYIIMKGKQNIMNEKTKEFRQQIAEVFIRSLEEKQLGWKKEWNAQSMLPINAINNKTYKGINKFWLSLVAMSRRTDDPRWCTFKQIQDKGWKLNKGSKGAKVEYWMPYDKNERKGITWEDYRKRNGDPSVILVSRYYVVFNGKDIEGIPPLLPLEVNSINQDELIAKLSKNMAVEILNDGGDRAFYNPMEDKIHLPKQEYFVSNYAYNATSLHEIAHSTGAAHRLNRNIMNMFGSSDYAYEELIAEITSCFMSINLKVVQDENHINNHKAYVQSWINAIKEKPETLIKAIREAEKTANYMEYKAELISEKDYRTTLNESIEVNENDIQTIEPEKTAAGNITDEHSRRIADIVSINARYKFNALETELTAREVQGIDYAINVNFRGYTNDELSEANALQQEKDRHKRVLEIHDEKKSLKDIQKSIDEYKQGNPSNKVESNIKKDSREQR